ncbi:MAG: Methylated-thiol--coenzyme M methyltransferase [Candidatus Methanofastidiosum methylothiophilum]|uniref:Methylated-thiol--coenzyme M methyltransferase n=1 Tax=Candidatus Methanofastidiosum methylothiophilum TaxID=1705564 RepID=A0A150JES2_9EURY|nr:MAG: Methylated-thiol--coenzyme M methyltransferase [Candidatus Methanofastidiosum methylthiophilus]MBP6931835.1 MtaA/CmuA family methyltransferase [Methanofastidiosum sp.]OQC50601.1 MAG: Methylated-thiol--coenzyme M methyltransferase [Euryarchaeota archaeon ADurb.Bin023]KYC55752.1 MAG: Methylated-thiol--coenzyme M methyltransferase [Candidatus Methanofastidiosum methylthiophilus]KYC57808.1 MAG: Methylated-thiol--coenzyme M methyltransferase [Candidatus Methanofastidiosum methylthiophilus]
MALREMTPYRRFMSAMTGGRVDRPSVIALSNFCKELMTSTNVTWPACQTDSKALAQFQAGRYEVWGIDLIISHNDLVSEATTLDTKIDLGSDVRHPSVLEHKLEKIDPTKYDLPKNVLETGRNPMIEGAVKILSAKYEQLVPVFRTVTGPMTVAGHLWGVDKILMWSKQEEKKFEACLDICTDLCIEIIRNSVDSSGADGYYLPDPTASGDLLDPKDYQYFLEPRYKRMTKELKDVPGMLHICGDTRGYMDRIPHSGFDAFSYEAPGTSTKEAKMGLGDRITLVGSLETIPVIMQGTSEYVYKQALRDLADGSDILSPACGTPPFTPNANIRAMVEAAEPKKVKRKVVLLSKEEIIKKYTPSKPEFAEMTHAVMIGDDVTTEKLVVKALDKGLKPIDIVEEALLPGAIGVAEMYDGGYAFVPEILLAANAMKKGISHCQSAMGDVKPKGKIIMHVAFGDVHAIGKDIVKSILTAKGYQVTDLGASVAPEKVVEAAKKEKPDIVSGTALMTTTRTAFPKVIELLKKEGLEIPFIAAGGAVDPAYAETMDYAIFCKGPGDAEPVFEGIRKGKKWQQIREEEHRKYK